MKEDTPNRRQNSFDQLRLIAAFFVIITHSYALLGLPETDVLYLVTRGATSFSTFGLWIFFVISGYLVTASALRSTSLWRYIQKRMLRIVPAFFVVILFAVGIIGSLFTTVSFLEYIKDPVTWNYLKGLTFFRLQYNLPGVFLSNPYPGAINGSLWTIPYEIALYSIPAFVLMLRGAWRRVIRYVFSILWAFGIFSVLKWSTFLWGHTIPVLQLNMYHAVNFGLFFLAGSLLYVYKDVISLKSVPFLLCLIVWIVSFFTPYRVIANYIVVPYIILFVATSQLFVFKSIQRIPDISYGLYLYAFPVQQSLAALYGTRLSVSVFALLSLCATIPFAWLSWKYIEEPFLRRRNIHMKYQIIRI